MGYRKSLLGGALMLTAVNLLLRFAGTSFQIWLSGRIGAAGIGLLQLILSVNLLALTLGAAGGTIFRQKDAGQKASPYLCGSKKVI